MNDFMNWIEETFDSNYEGTSSSKPEEKTEKQTAPITKENELTLDKIRHYYYRDETGAAELAKYFIGENFVFNTENKTWYKRESYYWNECENDEPIAKIITDKVIPEYQRLADSEADEKSAGTIRKHAREYFKINKIENVLKGLRRKYGKKVVWTQPENKLPLRNGLVDLSTGNFVEPEKGEFIKNVIDVEYKGRSYRNPQLKIDDIVLQQCDKFDGKQFEEDYEKYKYFWKALGGAMKGTSPEKKFFILYGPRGDNGKSMLFTILSKVFTAEYVASIPPIMLLKGGESGTGPNPMLMHLKNKRIVYFPELNEGQSLNSALVKNLTGGDILSGHDKYKGMEEFKPTHTAFMYTNVLPHLNVNDEALLKRIVVIPFDVSFVEKPQKDWEKPRIEGLEKRLLEDESSIVSWIVEGALLYEKEGLKEPSEIVRATEKYFEAEDGFKQTMAQILTEDFVKGVNETEKTSGKEQKFTAAELYEKYTIIESKPMAFNSFSKRLPKLVNEGILKETSNTGGKKHYTLVKPLMLGEKESEDVVDNIEIPF